LAEICGQYLDKGTKVYIEGAIRTRSFVGNDGQKKWFTDIQANELVILSPKGTREQVPEYPEAAGEYPTKPEAVGEKPASSTELPETLNLDEDVDFF